MNSLFKKIGNYIPLKAEFLDVEDYFISFGAKNWNFYSDANWRIIKGQEIIMTDDEFDIQSLKKIILSEVIEDISPSTLALMDPIFKFSSGYCLEFFSKSQTESWKLSLPDFVYVQ